MPPPCSAELPLIVLRVTLRVTVKSLSKLKMPPPMAGRVAADRTAGDGQVFQARDRAAVAGYVAAGERQAADRNLLSAVAVAVVDVEHPAAVAVVLVRRRVVAAGVDRQQVRARAVDRELLVDHQLAERELDRRRAAAGEGWGKVDRLARRGRGDGVAEGNAANADAVVFIDQRVDGDRQQPPIFERLDAEPAPILLPAA